MNGTPSEPIYVAYRRPDMALVGLLVDTLTEALGPPPAGRGSWFFMDTRSIQCGDQWYYQINAAHRAASCVLGVLSSDTVPRKEADYHWHGIYLDELYLAQRTGRLVPVRIDDGTEDLYLLGLGMTQSSIWTGTQTDAIDTLTTAIRSRAPKLDQNSLNRNSHHANSGDPPLRMLWKTRCVDAGYRDQLVTAGAPDGPTIIRPVPAPYSRDGILRISKRPVCEGARLDELRGVFAAAQSTGLDFRLPFSFEARDLLGVPDNAGSGWQHPLDLAVTPGGSPVWALDQVCAPMTLASDGTPTDTPTTGQTAADVWLILDERM